jgi:hypothetical protein
LEIVNVQALLNSIPKVADLCNPESEARLAGYPLAVRKTLAGFKSQWRKPQKWSQAKPKKDGSQRRTFGDVFGPNHTLQEGEICTLLVGA